MRVVWGFLLVVALPLLVYRLLRPSDTEPTDDFLPFPLVLRAAGGLRQYPGFLLLGAVANAPIALFAFEVADPTRVFVIVVGLAWATLTLPLLLQGAVTVGALRPLRHMRSGSRHVVLHGLRSLALAVPSVTLVAGLTLLPIGLVLLVPQGVAERHTVLLAVGTLMLTVHSALYLAPALAVDRGRTLFRALRESLVLTCGYRMRIAGIVLLFAVFEVLVVGGVVSWLMVEEGRAASPWLFIAVLYPVLAVLATWHAVTAVIVYHRLRKLRYGGEVDGLEAIFE